MFLSRFSGKYAIYLFFTAHIQSSSSLSSHNFLVLQLIVQHFTEDLVLAFMIVPERWCWAHDLTLAAHFFRRMFQIGIDFGATCGQHCRSDQYYFSFNRHQNWQRARFSMRFNEQRIFAQTAANQQRTEWRSAAFFERVENVFGAVLSV